MKVSNFWTQPCSIDETLAFCDKVTGLLASRLKGTDAHHVAFKLASRDYKGLASISLDYRDPNLTVDTALTYRQIQAMYSKLEDLDLGIDKDAVALSKYLDAEDLCRHTNSVIRSTNGLHTLFEGRDNLVLYKARAIFRGLLGDVPDDFGKFKFKHGPGATTTIKSRDCAIHLKMGDTPTCSYEFYRSPLYKQFMREIPAWLKAHTDENGKFPLRTTVGQVIFVTKDWKTSRTIDMQATLNAFFQKGVGRYLSKRFLRYGLDLYDNTLNKYWAKVGSISREVDTHDLTSASDTVSNLLVKFFATDDWWCVFSALTPRYTRVKDPATGKYETIQLEKFASMGNGLTFPIESAIFYSLALATKFIYGHEGPVQVFGDDVIFPTSGSDDLVRIFTKCGFIHNTAKSCCGQIPFRESCGADYFRGFDIRPYYQKHLISGQSLFVMHNFFAREGDTEMCDLILDHIPEPLKLWGPDGYGDGHLITTSYHKQFFKSDLKKGWGGWRFDTYTLKPKTVRTKFPGDWVSPLYHIYVAGGDDSEPMKFDKDGFPYWPLRLEKDYEAPYGRQSIYTLVP